LAFTLLVYIHIPYASCDKLRVAPYKLLISFPNTSVFISFLEHMPSILVTV